MSDENVAPLRSLDPAVLAAHGDLYARHRDGFACLHIREGRVALGSVNAAPLGVKPLFDPSRFERQPMP